MTMIEKEKKIDQMILEAENRLWYVGSYDDSISDLNSILEEENEQLAYEVKDTLGCISDLDRVIADKKCEFLKNESNIKELKDKVTVLKKEIDNVKQSDLSLILHLQKEIEKLTIITNLPHF